MHSCTHCTSLSLSLCGCVGVSLYPYLNLSKSSKVAGIKKSRTGQGMLQISQVLPLLCRMILNLQFSPYYWSGMRVQILSLKKFTNSTKYLSLSFIRTRDSVLLKDHCRCNFRGSFQLLGNIMLFLMERVDRRN